jgi:hypothetical protein
MNLPRITDRACCELALCRPSFVSSRNPASRTAAAAPCAEWPSCPSGTRQPASSFRHVLPHRTRRTSAPHPPHAAALPHAAPSPPDAAPQHTATPHAGNRQLILTARRRRRRPTPVRMGRSGPLLRCVLCSRLHEADRRSRSKREPDRWGPIPAGSCEVGRGRGG